MTLHTPRTSPLSITLAMVLAVIVCKAPPLAAADAPAGPNPRLPWLHEGLAINSTWYAAVHPGSWSDFTEDENGHWVSAGGVRLDMTERRGNSAGGLTQTVVTCIDGDNVCLCTNAFFDMRLLRFPDPLPNFSPLTFIVNLGHCDLWIEPAALALMRSDPATHTVVQPIQWKAGDRQIDVIRVTSVGADHYMDRLFDRKTGYCVHYGESWKVAAARGRYFLRGQAADSDTILTGGDFISVRDIPTPWAAEPMPDWTHKRKALHYRGTTGFMGVPAIVGPPVPLSLDVSITKVGNGWLSTATSTLVQHRGIPGVPSKGLQICGRDQFHALFAGPLALARLHEGQVLDEDPLTRIRTIVTEANDRAVTITASNASGQVVHTYDRQTGKLIAGVIVDNFSKSRSALQLESEQ